MIEYRLHLPDDLVSYAYEVEAKGYLSGVRVTWNTKSCDLIFYDAARLAQEISDELNSSGYFIEPGLVVVPRVTQSDIEAAVRSLAEYDFVDLSP